MIKKLGNYYYVYGEDGSKQAGPFSNRSDAEARAESAGNRRTITTEQFWDEVGRCRYAKPDGDGAALIERFARELADRLGLGGPTQ